MEREELLNQFNELLDSYQQHKAYGDKAREQASNFSSAVIEKVMADHQIKASLISDDISPLVPQLTEEIDGLNNAIGSAEQSKGDLGTRIEELELRKIIGEISDEEFESMTAEGRDTVESADKEIAELETVRSTIQQALDRWVELSGSSIVQESEEGNDPIVESILPDIEEDGDSVEIEGDELVGFDLDESVDAVDVADVVDVVEEDEGADAAVEVEVDEEDSDDGDDAPEIAIPELVQPDGDSDISAIGVDMSEEVSHEGEDADGPRRAILLSNEGTPDEQIYALTGEVFTVGRGRDNDLQIKNDSKVSRFHCKLYRRGTNYYLEDNKSSNGTMVNGELISERRLFGGEEVVIGETFFRFRVM